MSCDVRFRSAKTSPQDLVYCQYVDGDHTWGRYVHCLHTRHFVAQGEGGDATALVTEQILAIHETTQRLIFSAQSRTEGWAQRATLQSIEAAMKELVEQTFPPGGVLFPNRLLTKLNLSLTRWWQFRACQSH